MHIVVLGAKGMIGKDVMRIGELRGHVMTGYDLASLNVTDEQAVYKEIEVQHPDAVVNCTADNALDLIESDDARFASAMRVNGDAPGYIAKAAKQVGAVCVHISSDYVFAGDERGGYAEDALPHPVSRYGISKRAGEEAVEKEGGQWYVLRTSKTFGEKALSENAKEDVVSLMIRLGNTKPELQVVNEEEGCPTFTEDFSVTLLDMLEQKRPSGIYHVINSGPGVNVYEFVQEIFAEVHISTPLIPVPRSAFPRPTPCPQFAVLLNTKLPPLRPRSEALHEFLSRPRV
jgi:dTDP-4-dehydrorhamnose reductase